MAFTNTWDTAFGDDPGDTESRKYGAQQIRKLKDAIVERLQVDHEFGEELIGSGVDDQTDSGYHKRVTLLKGSVTEPASGYTELAAEGTKLKYFPEGDSEREVVDTDQAQTLTNKTLTSPTVSGGTINGGSGLVVNSTELNQLKSVTVGGTSSGDIVTVGGAQILSNKNFNTKINYTAGLKGLIPIAIGFINSNGSISNSVNVTSSTNASTGVYHIYVSGWYGGNDNVVLITPASGNYTGSGHYLTMSGYIKVEIRSGGALANYPFSIVVFNPAP